MANKPLHDKLVHHSVYMLDLYLKQLELSKEMVHDYEFRITAMEEFIRANITGDERVFKILAPMVGKGTGTKRPIYDTGFSDGVKTKKAVQQAREWSAANEPEEGTSAVSSLQEGSATDQAREVPAPQGSAGFVLPPVESEGGAID